MAHEISSLKGGRPLQIKNPKSYDMTESAKWAKFGSLVRNHINGTHPLKNFAISCPSRVQTTKINGGSLKNLVLERPMLEAHEK